MTNSPLFNLDASSGTEIDRLIKADKHAFEVGQSVIYLSPGINIDADENENFSNANHVILIGDKANINNTNGPKIHAPFLGKPSIFPGVIRSAHLKQSIKSAKSTGKLRITIMGDSICDQNSPPAESENYFYALIEEIQLQNPGIDIAFRNAALGGTSWADMVSDTYLAPKWLNPLPNENWKSAVARYCPDLLILHSNGNSVPYFNPNHVLELVKFFKSLPKSPDIIFGITHAPSYSNDTGHDWMKYHTREWQHGLASANGWLRSFCQENGYGYLDFDRWMSIRRDGMDIGEVALSLIKPQAGTSVPAWKQPVECNSSNKWIFPDAFNSNGTPASACTDFAHSFSLSKNPRIFGISLREAGEEGQISPIPNALYLRFDDPSGNISISWSNGSTIDQENSVISDVKIPVVWPVNFSITVKGARVLIKIYVPFVRNPDFAPGDMHRFGLGYTTLFDRIITRFGGEWCPLYAFAESNIAISTYGLSVGSRRRPNGDTPQNIPDRICYDLYKMDGETSERIHGSNAYHLNVYAIRDILVPVIRIQNWQILN